MRLNKLNASFKIHLILVWMLLGVSTLRAQENRNQTKTDTMHIAFIMFDDYETLDVFGPAEVFGRLTDLYSLGFYSLEGGIVSNRHGVPIKTEKLATLKNGPEIILVPGGWGTRKEVDNPEILRELKRLSESSTYTLTVCTGSGLLAKTGLLDNREATSNKRAFKWASSQGADVKWDKKARWKVDGKYYTSSGVSAGMDMAFGFLADRHGLDFARKIAKEIECHWIEDKDNDTFTAD
ncbi:MAG: DJ-1/PfpI family protein [Pricia sp.]